MLFVNKLSFSFNTLQVLDNLSLSLPQGDIGTLIGPSGAGKTTLFKLLTGLLAPQAGTISISGSTPTSACRHVAYMMQDDLLLPWRTILDNLTLIGELGKQSICQKSLRQEARSYLHEVGLADWEDAYPNELSVGMRQRASLSRALLQKRPLLLLDEPFGSLDVALREQMHTLLRELRLKHGTTVLMVTHDFRDALSLSDRIFFLDKGCINHEWMITDMLRGDPLAIQKITNEMKASFNRKSLGDT